MKHEAMTHRSATPAAAWYRLTRRDYAALCCEGAAGTRLATADPLGRLMQAAQAGDTRAYDALLRAMMPFLRAIIRRRLFDAAEAEDAVQDALLSLHALRHTYDPSRPFKAWVTAIAERRAIDRLRRSGRRRRHEVMLTQEVSDATVGEEAGAEAAVLAAELRAAVARLPASQRTAVQLAKLQDRPLAEASAMSGLAVSALKVATHRAIGSLRRHFAPAQA